jgi:site-specific recombinase XerD
MTSLAPILQSWFTDRLLNQRQASPHTIAAYRDTFRLLLGFVHQRAGTPPSRLDLADLDAATVVAFLEHLEVERHNSVRTRNARLAAIHSFFAYAALGHPDHVALIQQVLAIPDKRHDSTSVEFLTEAEVDALLAAPDRATWTGRRDHALLVLAIQTGLRASELLGLTCANVVLGTAAHVACRGKGRKHRCTPLTAQTAAVLNGWLRERNGGPDDPVFPSRLGGRLSHDALGHLLNTHLAAAGQRCPTLRTKRTTPHTLRHTAAMRLLQAGVDTSVIALWLGHESTKTTQIYLHADLALKDRALARTAQPTTTLGRYRPPDKLLAFLEAL